MELTEYPGVPPTAQDDTIRPTATDEEKPEVTRLEAAYPDPSATEPAIDPLAEKRYLRKLDFRLPVLLGALCMCSSLSNAMGHVILLT